MARKKLALSEATRRTRDLNGMGAAGRLVDLSHDRVGLEKP